MDESFSLTSQMDSHFRDEISTKRVEFDTWVEERVSNFGLEKDTHTRTMEKLASEFRELSEQERMLRMKSDHLQLKMQQENAEMNQLQDQLKELQCEESSLPPILSTLRSDLEKEKSVAEKKRQELLKAKQVKEYKDAELSKGLSFYQQRLGLDIKKTNDGNLKFIFTKLDPKDPLREFYFVLKVVSEGEVEVYKTVSCVPYFEGSEKCEAQLNRSGNLSRFFCLMRQGFRQLVDNSP